MSELDKPEQEPAKYTVVAPNLGELARRWADAPVQSLAGLPDNLGFETLYEQDAGEVNILDPNPNLRVTLKDLLLPDTSAPTKLEASTHRILVNGRLQTVRDVLVWGKERIENIYGIESSAIDLLQSRIAALDSALEWKPQPDISDWVRLCDTLYDIPAGSGMRFLRLSIGEVLALSDQEVADHYFFSARKVSGYAAGMKMSDSEATATHLGYAASLRKKAEKIAKDFSAAQKARREQLAQRPRDADG